MYVNKVQKLFLSIYVDDFKMAGKASSLKPMWEKLNKVLELEKPQPLQKIHIWDVAKRLNLLTRILSKTSGNFGTP